MTSFLTALVFAATLPVAAPGLLATDVAGPTVEVANEHLARQLGERGLPTQAGGRIAGAVGAERQRQLIGCLSRECLDELRTKLEVEAVLNGTLARAGDEILVSLQLVSTHDGSPLASFEGKAATMTDLPQVLTQAAEQLSIAAWTAVDLQASPPARTGRIVASVLSLVVAVGSLVTAGVMWGLSISANDRLSRGDATLGTGEAFRLARAGQMQQTVAIVTTAVGAAALIATIGIVLSTASEPQGRLVLMPTGNGLLLSGSF